MRIINECRVIIEPNDNFDLESFLVQEVGIDELEVQDWIDRIRSEADFLETWSPPVNGYTSCELRIGKEDIEPGVGMRVGKFGLQEGFQAIIPHLNDRELKKELLKVLV